MFRPEIFWNIEKKNWSISAHFDFDKKNDCPKPLRC